MLKETKLFAKKSKKAMFGFLVVLIIGMSGFLLGGCAANGGTAPNSGTVTNEQEYLTSGVLNAGHAVDVTHPFQVGLEYFADRVYERTDGRFSINIHHSGVLGGEVAILDMINAGDIEVMVSSTGPIMNFTSAFSELDLPFLLEDKAHAYAVLDGSVGQGMLDELEETTNLVGLAFFENGFRHVTSSVRPIYLPEDLQGVVFRTQENPIHLRTFGQDGFGAVPMAMAFGELFMGLQQGVAEGQENPLMTTFTGRFHEVQSYMAMTYHFYSAAPLLINQDLWNSLSPADQAIFQQAAIEARYPQRAAVDAAEEFLSEELKNYMLITHPDLTPWREAAEPIINYFIEQGVVSANVVQQIRDVAAEIAGE